MNKIEWNREYLMAIIFKDIVDEGRYIFNL